jgi:mannose-6-phosphate isomerase-like protein (cupin superfamily)
MPTRRIVTAHDPDGRSIIATDSEVEDVTISLATGMVFTLLFGSDKPAELALDGRVPGTAGYFPASRGVTATLVTVPPDADAPTPPSDISAEQLEQMMAEGFAEAEQKLPGLAAVMEPDHPGFHTTDTIDLVYLVSGTLVLETTADPSTTVAPGDVVIQNGTRHAWRNPGSEPATMFAISLGIDR